MVSPLNILIQSALPSVYDDSLSHLELLGKVIAKVNELAAATNTILDTDINTIVSNQLAAWETDGTLAALVNPEVIAGYEAADALIEADITAVKGVGWTNETVKANADAITVLGAANGVNSEAIADLAGAGRTTETVKANADAITALGQATYNVKKYGAVGSGLVDDTAAIKAAITAAAPVNGCVFLPAGIYLVSETLALKTRMTLRGAGAGSTVLKEAAVFTGSKVIGLHDDQQHHIEISDLGILGVGRDGVSGVTGIDLTNTFQVIPQDNEVYNRVRNVQIKQMSGFGIKTAGRGNDVYDTIDVYRTALAGFYINKWDSVFTNCSVGQSYTKAFHLDNQTASCMFTNCKGWGSNSGFYIDGVENTFEGCQAQENANWGFILALNGKKNTIRGIINGNGYNSTDPAAAAIYINGDQNLVSLAITNRLMAMYGGDCMTYGILVSGKHNQIQASIEGATNAVNPTSDLVTNDIQLLSPTKGLRHMSLRRTYSRRNVTSGNNLTTTMVAALRDGSMMLLTVQDTVDRTLFATYICNVVEGSFNDLYLVANKTITLASVNAFGTINIVGGSGTYNVTAVPLSVSNLV